MRGAKARSWEMGDGRWKFEGRGQKSEFRIGKSVSQSESESVSQSLSNTIVGEN